MAKVRAKTNPPVEPKVPVTAVTGGVVGGLVVLVIDLINGAPLDENALTIVLTAVISFLLSLGAGWLKTTPATTLVARKNAAVVAAGVRDDEPPTTP